MYKVVFNNCYGGFNLSKEAVDWLEDHCKDNELRELIKSVKSDIMSDDIISNKYLHICYSVVDWFDKRRHHSDLIAVVEALGNAASGDCAALCIAKIDSKQYRIDEYDGAEEIVTPDGEDWIFIND